jgi:hypothetical protein
VAGELQEVEVAQRLRDPHGRVQALLEAGCAQARACARVHWEHRRQRQALGEGDDPLEPLGHIDVPGAVDGHQQVLAGLDRVVLKRRRALLGDRHERQGDVRHHIAHEVDVVTDVLGRQVLHGGGGGAEEHVARVVGQHAVQLLGHHPVERAHSRLDVRHGDAHLGCRKGAGERRVRVPVDQNPVGDDLRERTRKRGDHARGLLAVRAVVDVQLTVGCRDSQLVEEDPAEVVVVVLTGVDQHLVALLAQFAGHRRGLHELRPVSNDRRYQHCVIC